MKSEFAFNSTLRPISKKKMAQKKPLQRKKPLPLSEVKKRFEITVAALLGPPKPRKPMKKRSDSNPGWYGWALVELWPNVDHECCVCGTPIEEPVPHVFSHLLERGAYKRYARDPRNVVIMDLRCHDHWHSNKARILESPPKEWKEVAELYLALRDEANGVGK